MAQNTLKNSISRRTSFILSIVVTVIFLLTSAVFISDHVTSANQQMLQKLEATTRLVKTSLVSVIWHLNIPAIDNVLEAIIADENITFVSLAIDDEVISKRVQPEYTQHDFDYFVNKNGFIVQTTDIQHLGTKIGRFQIVFTRQKIDERLVFEVSVIVTISILTMIFIFFLMLFITRRFILDPLSKLEQSAMHIADGTLEMSDWTSFPLIDNEDEFGVLSRAFNKLIWQLKDNIDTLDIKVIERTIELEEAMEKAEKAAQSKTEFLATMSHEIRTPLNTICGMAEMLLETPLTKQQEDYSKILISSSDLLLSIINDILDFSKIDSEQIELESIPFELSDLVDSVNSILVASAQEKGLELINWLDTNVSNLRIGDSTRLHQILINLLGNAIKFTKKGEVTLEIVNHPDPHKSDWIQFHVRDTGIGIPEDKQQEIFEHFSQADMTTTRKYGGTGLGLAISKKLVEMMGGKISVNSKVDKGTEFIIDVQLPVAEKGLPEEKLDVDIEGINVLIVDDNQKSQDILKNLLSSKGANISLAKNGGETLEVLIDAKKKNIIYHLIIIDYKLEGMGGVELINHIKMIQLSKEPSIILNTMIENEGNGISKEIPNGITHLTKPVTVRNLYKAVSQALSHQQESVQSVFDPVIDDQDSTALIGNHSDIRILLAEDIKSNQELIKYYLNDFPVKLDIVTNGLQAVSKYKKNSYDLILMDIQMPKMDGYAATAAIRLWENENDLPRIPVIAITAHAFKQQREKCIEVGCDYFLSKPVTKKSLIKIISKLSN
jgi:signal transduction histidine kinase/CheY-like chemotaxis protein